MRLPVLLSSAPLLSHPLLALAKPLEYQVQRPPLTTNWTYSVGTDPWTEYPRPQMRRDRWQSLNGVWSYRNATGGLRELEDDKGPPEGQLDRAVMVPSCLESGLSGIQAPLGSVQYSWFQTTFTVPSDWKGQSVVLNFGAVDYEATVYINGKNATFHRGGYTRFHADITQYLKATGEENELVVFVHDPTDSGDHVMPIGKQTLEPSHIFYTPCSGIWQSVFIEPVPPGNAIESIDVSAEMDGTVNITVHSSSPTSSQVQAKILDPSTETVLATQTGQPNEPFTLKVDSPRLWSPDKPNLYNITVQLGDDSVTVYTGFRSLGKGMVNGVQRALLNGEALFAFGPLDQGYWPDGLYTPPSYEAMTYDLRIIKQLGFNMVRKHVKVEPDLFYHACDTMGLLVMQDMPSMRASQDIMPSRKQQAEFQRQLLEMVKTHKSFPSIYTWVIYNEGWGQLASAPELQLTPLVRSFDPTRLINSVTGWNDHGAGDYLDNHHYPDPQCGTPSASPPASPYDPSRIGFQGEFGGLGHNVSIDHLWNVQKAIDTINQTYELDANLTVWNHRAHHILETLKNQTERYACSGGVWTQTTDVEGEVNGLLTYDRNILRPDVAQWQVDIAALYAALRARVQEYPQTMVHEDGGSGVGWVGFTVSAWWQAMRVWGFKI